MIATGYPLDLYPAENNLTYTAPQVPTCPRVLRFTMAAPCLCHDDQIMSPSRRLDETGSQRRTKLKSSNICASTLFSKKVAAGIAKNSNLSYVDGSVEDAAGIEWSAGRKDLTRIMKKKNKTAESV